MFSRFHFPPNSYESGVNAMGKFASSIMICTIAAIISSGVARASDGETGFTLKQLNNVLAKAGIATQRVESILTFSDLGEAGSHIAILSSSRSGWRVTVLRNLAGGLKVEWTSGGLQDDFSVSSPDALEIDDLGEEQVVEFSGCAPHDCGGLDGVSGMVLYAPRVKQAFFVHYRSDSKKGFGSFGSLDFSDNAEVPANARYKAALEKAMRKELYP